MSHYIKSMRGLVMKQRGYGQNGYELAVTIQFDAKEFNRIKKKHNPLEVGMAQIKNVVLDAVGVRGIPSYAPKSYSQRWPRASKGVVELTVYFEISEYQVKALQVDTSQYSVYHPVSLNETLELTRNDGHLFAKSVIAAKFSN